MAGTRTAGCRTQGPCGRRCLPSHRVTLANVPRPLQYHSDRLDELDEAVAVVVRDDIYTDFLWPKLAERLRRWMVQHPVAQYQGDSTAVVYSDLREHLLLDATEFNIFVTLVVERLKVRFRYHTHRHLRNRAEEVCGQYVFRPRRSAERRGYAARPRPDRSHRGRRSDPVAPPLTGGATGRCPISNNNTRCDGTGGCLCPGGPRPVPPSCWPRVRRLAGTHRRWRRLRRPQPRPSPSTPFRRTCSRCIPPGHICGPSRLTPSARLRTGAPSRSCCGRRVGRG